ncbi:chemotaxis response regulator protein-glutamate methylesterase [Saccharibacillus sp. O23]|uniref:chemotaxis protein CheB n=1 Tax=Saccharibacillus sp. O23 TaxID=2009338 RepID=UPI000B4DF9BA|nr:chemotaxis protein CheB [Saccharibacillus sp. O23]OWR27863.1 chemotaxis response regulator protein-glutamate methylesterase [Saccharibacillus sp. O23]
MTPYRVLVVDDSAFMRKIVSDLIERDVSFSVVDTARNGREAVEKIRKIKPDIVTMDVEMPEMNGLESLQHIMREYPLPVIMLSGINEEGMRETIMALEAGAFDFIRKPSVSNSQDIEAVGEALLRQLHAAVHDSAWRKEKPATTKAPIVLAPEPAEPELREATAEPPSVDPRRPEDRTSDLPRPKIEPSAPELRPRKDGNSGFTPAPRTAAPTPTPKKNPLAPPPSAAPSKPARPPAVQPERPAAARSTAPADKPGARIEPAAAPAKKPASTAPAQDSFKSPAQERKTPDRQADRPVSPPAAPLSRAGGGTIDQIVAVGCSTGGPRALKELLENIPASFPAPIVIVQHMPPKFTHSLAQRLNTLSPLEVVEAQQGMPLRKGTAYIAPGGQHLLVKRSGSGQYAIELSDAPPQNGHKPSVGAMFDSVLQLNEVRRHAVIMTGMGSDGAKEMKKLYDSGISTTIAESEETCVVYGMPRAAAELNCVMHLLPLPQIATKLNQVVKS